MFRDAGTLPRSLSLHPEDRPPEPFVYRNLEEIAEKLGARTPLHPGVSGCGPAAAQHSLSRKFTLQCCTGKQSGRLDTAWSVTPCLAHHAGAQGVQGADTGQRGL